VSVVSDEDALIAAIEAAPFDDAPRLVYADWLQERGEDQKAEYLRTVVRLIHAPDDRTDVESCISLAQGLDAEWRKRVGGCFEVMVEGLLLRAVAYAFQALLKFVRREPVSFSDLDRRVTLKSAATREDAEQLIDTYREFNPRVQVMNEESGPGLLAP
jgi:uncharacterized protein (TIGR02996 family)